jgi:hypothetical protein
MRNVVTIPLSGSETLIIASDNSGAIGLKSNDLVQVPYETVAYFSFRVAVMECISAGGEPISVILSNFCGNEAWEELIKGIQKGLAELNLRDIPISGSTESNFDLTQSAIGIMVLGKKSPEIREVLDYNERSKIAIIGKPLVGNEVIEQEDQIVPLSLFQKVSKLADVVVWPVGSKGIFCEMNRMFTNKKFLKEKKYLDLDIFKSSGPATCFIAVFQEDSEEELQKLTEDYFHLLSIKEPEY